MVTKKETMDLLVQKIKETASLYEGLNYEQNELCSLQTGITLLISMAIVSVQSGESVNEKLSSIKSTY